MLDLTHRLDDAALIDSVFRGLHTLKGSGAMFGFDALAAFTHHIESAFDRVRKGRARATLELIATVLAARHDPRTPGGAQPGTVAFRNVHFGYNANREILRGVSFTAAAGAKLAIVGPTGAGKSTISRLLFRFYDVNEGAVEIVMTLTAPGCPVAGEMPGWVADAVNAVPGVRQVDVAMTFGPQWGMEMMSDEARLELGFM